MRVGHRRTGQHLVARVIDVSNPKTIDQRPATEFWAEVAGALQRTGANQGVAHVVTLSIAGSIRRPSAECAIWAAGCPSHPGCRPAGRNSRSRYDSATGRSGCYAHDEERYLLDVGAPLDVPTCSAPASQSRSNLRRHDTDVTASL